MLLTSTKGYQEKSECETDLERQDSEFHFEEI